MYGGAQIGVVSVREAAEQRRSIRAFEREPIPREELNAILEATALAPSAFNLQPWRFVVVESPEAKSALAEAAHRQRQVLSAPTVLVLYTDMRDALENIDEAIHPGMGEAQQEAVKRSVLGSFAARSPEEREAWGAEQGHIALGFLLLAASGQGYQTSAMAGFDAEAVKRVLGLPAHVRIPALVAIGRGAEEGFEHHRHPLERIVRAA